MEEIEGILPNTQVFAQEGDCLQICVWYKFSNLTFYQRYINEQAVQKCEDDSQRVCRKNSIQ